MIFTLISLFLLLPYMALLLFYRYSWRQMKKVQQTVADQGRHQTFITVIIAARNEEKTIRSCIQSVIDQTYPAGLFELIVVDDHSVDTTASIAGSFNRDNIRVIKLVDFTGNKMLNSYKKKAVETAIGLSKGTLVVTTDADCLVPPKWLDTIASYYENTGFIFIAAPVSYLEGDGRENFFKKFFRIFQSLDFMMLQGITGASVNKQFHDMCNGANLAYEKKAFYEAGGFEGIDHIASGDDMLLMHKIHKLHPGKTGFLKSIEAIVQTRPTGTLREFINQRIRWASKADQYPDIKITSVLLLVYLFNAWLLLLAFFSFNFFYAGIMFLVLLAAKTAVELFFLFPVATFFKKKKLLWAFIPSQPFHIIYTLIAGWLGKFGSYTWKDRKVK